jgi:hypothetical protein
MDYSWTRRTFLSRAAGSAASLAIATPGQSALAYGAGTSALRGRFLTHVSVVRVNQSRSLPIVRLATTRPRKTAQTVSARGGKALREAVRRAG